MQANNRTAPVSGATKMIVLIGVCVFFAALLPAVIAYKDQLLLFSNEEGFAPTSLQRVMVGGLLLLFVVAFALFVFTLETVSKDYEAFSARNREASSPPADSTSPAHERMQQAYLARGFVRVGELSEVEDAPELWSGPLERDEADMFRRPGVLIYEDGRATQFSIAVIYGNDVWAAGDEINVERGTRRRPVTIRTALNRQLVRELIQANDYVLTVGLASSSPARDDERNDNLAHARAWNIGVAILKLRWKEAGRIVGISFGHAVSEPQLPALEPRQRSVVIVGVNASREVNVLDVIEATARLVTVDGLDLERYSTRVRFRALPANADYRKASDINVGARSGDGWILPALSASPSAD